MLYFICHVFQPCRFCATSVNYYLGHDKSVEYSNILRLFFNLLLLSIFGMQWMLHYCLYTLESTKGLRL